MLSNSYREAVSVCSARVKQFKMMKWSTLCYVCFTTIKKGNTKQFENLFLRPLGGGGALKPALHLKLTLF